MVDVVFAFSDEAEVLLCTFSAGLLVAFSCTGCVSMAPPGVFGALLEEPNEAKAPDPSPNAVDPPTVGDAIVLLPPGVSVLKGFDLPWEEVSPPNLFAELKVRGESVLKASLGLLFECEVVRVSLLELPNISLFISKS